MAASKTVTSLVAAGTLTAGTPINSSAATLTTYDFATVLATITNPATAPTAPAVLTILVSGDNTTYYTIGTYPAGLVASAAYGFDVPLDPGISYVKITFSGNTGSNCTVVAQVALGTW